jgi:hypothetical protein
VWSKREPWQGQSQLFSALFQRTVGDPPRLAHPAHDPPAPNVAVELVVPTGAFGTHPAEAPFRISCYDT